MDSLPPLRDDSARSPLPKLFAAKEVAAASFQPVDATLAASSNCTEPSKLNDAELAAELEISAQTIKVFEEIRIKLVEEGGISTLPLDFPIKEMEMTADMSEYLGMCHFSSWFETGAERKKRESIGIVQRVEKVSVRLRSDPKPDGTPSQRYHLMRLIPTLLHEFAHATAELTRPLEVDSISNRQFKKMAHFSHDDFFYAHFRRILKAAELLGIYSLPNNPNKYHAHSLRRFDQVDLEVCPTGLCGSSKLYGDTFHVPGSVLPLPAPPKITFSVVLVNPKGARKFVQLVTDISLQNLKDHAAKKYNKKGMIRLLTTKGVEITEENFATVASGDTLQVL